ncbi:MAG: hypothetical protein LBR08_06255 [Bacteroidales bacterium]|nr:hypothetical protein [Bacteroidales bacterium]
MKKVLLMSIAAMTLLGCNKDEDSVPRREVTVRWYVLSEGSWGQANSDLACYDAATGVFTPGYFTEKNGSPLGDTGNDLKLYGAKMYCAVSGTDMGAGGSLKVIHPETGKLIKSIPATDGAGNPDMPRRIALHGGKVYVTMYSGSIARIDTATLTIDGRAALGGTYPEGICAYGDNLYVCNSGQGSGTALSVVNIAQFRETSTITVPQNPLMIEAAETGDIYFTTADVTWAGGEASNLHRFHAAKPEEIVTFGFRASRIAVGKEYVYSVDTDWSNFSTVVKKVDTKTGAVSDFITDDTGKDISSGYNVAVNPLTGEVYLTNMGEDIYMYDPNGKQTGRFATNLSGGSSFVFINR